MHGVIRAGRDIWTAFNADKVPRLASSIAFAALFSLAPLLIVLIAIAGWFIGLQHGGHGHHAAENALLAPVAQTAGAGASNAIREMVAASFNKPRQNVIAQIIGWVMFVFGAMALFTSIQDALNAIWQIESTKGGVRQMLRDKLAAFAMIAVVAILLLLSLVANSALAVAQNHFSDWMSSTLGGRTWRFSALGPIVTVVVAAFAFAAVYRVLPDVRLGWRDVWLGAGVTAVLFLIGEGLIAWYLAVAGTASAYGAAGSLLVMLLWIYYSAIIFLVGAEVTKVLARGAQTTAPAALRNLADHPAGVDPRSASNVKQ